MSFSVNAEGKTRADFVENLGQAVLKAVEQIEADARNGAPEVTAQIGTTERAQQEAAYTGHHDAASGKVERAKALVFRARDVLMGASAGAGIDGSYKATISGHSADDGRNSMSLQFSIEPLPADVGAAVATAGVTGAVAPTAARTPQEAEMVAEGLVPGQVSGPQASPAARARVENAPSNPPVTVARPSDATDTTRRSADVPEDLRKNAEPAAAPQPQSQPQPAAPPAPASQPTTGEDVKPS